MVTKPTNFQSSVEAFVCLWNSFCTCKQPNFRIKTCIKFVAALFKLHILPGELTYSSQNAKKKLSKKCVGDILSMKWCFIKSKCWDLPLTWGRLQTNKYLKQSCINVLHHNLLFYQTPVQIYSCSNAIVIC